MPCPILLYLVTESLCLLIAFPICTSGNHKSDLSFFLEDWSFLFLFHNSCHLQQHGCFVGTMDFVGSVLTETSQTKTSSVLYNCCLVFGFVLLVFFSASVHVYSDIQMISDDTIILFICNNGYFSVFNFCVYQELYKIYCSSSKNLVKIHQAFFPWT